MNLEFQISWIERVRLLFRRPKYYGSLVVKVMDGRIYVVGEKK